MGSVISMATAPAIGSSFESSPFRAIIVRREPRLDKYTVEFDSQNLRLGAHNIFRVIDYQAQLTANEVKISAICLCICLWWKDGKEIVQVMEYERPAEDCDHDPIECPSEKIEEEWRCA